MEDFRKSHNFDRNVIAANLADFGADGDDYSDDTSGDSFGHVSEGSFEDSEEEEVELTELEKESIAARSGVGEKRPSRALEQIMLGMNFDDDKQETPVKVSDKPATSKTNSKTSEDSHEHKEDDPRSQMMQGSKTRSQREKSGQKIDDIIKKPKHGGMPIPGGKMVSPTGRTSGGNSSVRVRRGKRTELAKSSSEAHRTRHHNASASGANPISPGRPRSLQHRSQSAADVGSPKPRNVSMQHRIASAGHRSVDEAKPDDSLSRGSGHGPNRRRGHRSATVEHHSGDAEKQDDPIPHGSGHGSTRRRRVPAGERSGDDEQQNDPIPRGSGHGPTRRRRVPAGQRSGDDEKPDDPIPRGSGHGPTRRRRARQDSAEQSSDDEKPDDPIPRGSGHGRRRSGRHTTTEHHHAGGDDDEKQPDDSLPRGSGHGKRRQPAAARRAPATPTRQASAVRRPKQATEPNSTKLGDSAGLKW